MYSAKRSEHNPILSPLESHSWESLAAFNWCPIVSKKDPKTIHCVYRAMSGSYLIPDYNLNISSIGYATSKDGIHYTDRKQLIKPELEWEQYGCEDPRVTELNGKYYIFYTALSVFPFRYDGIKIACAVTKDFKKIEKKHLITPFNAKAMALFPSRIGGKMVAILTANTDNVNRPARIALAYFDSEEDIWNDMYWAEWYKNLNKNCLHLRRVSTDHIEVGAVPLKTSDGWLFIYSHIQNYQSDKKIFGIEALLLDLKNPKKIVARTSCPMLIPEENYEKYGQTANVVFPSGAIIRDEYLWIYYGGADSTCCLAYVKLKNLLKGMRPETKNKCVVRFDKNPIISPVDEHIWEKKATFNPAAIELGGKIHIIYRAMSEDNTSTLGYAVSLDGLNITERLSEPIYQPREEFEAKKVPNGNSGCEDPRIVCIGDTLYMCYTAYNGQQPPAVGFTQIAVKDFLNRKWNWSKPVLITPVGIDDKDACIFPEKIDGQYVLIHRIKNQICLDFISSLERISEEVTKGISLLGPRHGMWDSIKVGLAGPPLKTKAGWILFYHGVSDDFHYKLGAALLDLKNPLNVLSRTSEAILEPQKKYEKIGQVPNVTFPCGHVVRSDTIYHYYGGADSVIGVATMKVQALFNILA
ncbi:MAG: hypothetical protein KBB01_03665 [Candidatus Omnitrophica bacterium]|jgi:predicted GH43/DUF377 family glycosyl hydrolase|nr:hypothetical protein [Candidatus Omnitrophota bacterium]